MENTAYRNAMELLARRRSQAEKDAALRREELYRSLPQLREYDGKAAALCRQMTTAVINGEPIEAYQKGLEQVQRDKLHTLAAAGIEEELLRPQYSCPLCRDTGYTEGRRCRCQSSGRGAGQKGSVTGKETPYRRQLLRREGRVWHPGTLVRAAHLPHRQ